MESIRRFQRFLPIHKGSAFLFGPRGTGKSTWLAQIYPDALRVDLLDPAQTRLYQARPERLAELILGNPSKTTILIDEAQKVPQLLDVVHSLVEKYPQLTFVLTGSSARKLKRGAANLLAGRLIQTNMHPFMASELGAAFTLEAAVRRGLVPLVFSSSDVAATLNAYAALYLQEEVQAEALVRNVGAFARFLEAISFSHGSTLNLNEVARECQVGRKSVEAYLQILEDLLLSFRVPVFTRRAKRHLVAHAKFYYFDAGVFRSLRPAGPLDKPEEIEGAALEGLVAQHLRAWVDYRRSGEGIYYWRTKSGTEVHFVIYGATTFVALEVKRAAKIHASDTKSLRAFKTDYPEANAILLYLGTEKLLIEGVHCIPCSEFLLKLRPDLALESCVVPMA